MNMWAHWKKYPFTHHPKSFDWNGFVKILTKILVLGFFLKKWLALGRDSTIHVIMAETIGKYISELGFSKDRRIC